MSEKVIYYINNHRFILRIHYNSKLVEFLFHKRPYFHVDFYFEGFRRGKAFLPLRTHCGRGEIIWKSPTSHCYNYHQKVHFPLEFRIFGLNFGCRRARKFSLSQNVDLIGNYVMHLIYKKYQLWNSLKCIFDSTAIYSIYGK